MKKYALILFFILFIIPHLCFGWGPAPLSFYYSGGTGSGRSTSDYNELAWSYVYSYHVMGASGDTMMGMLDSQLQFEERDGYSQMAYMRVGLSGKTYSVNIGDNTTRFSELTLNNMSYQGAGITIKPYRNFLLTLVGGSKGNSYWGREVRRDTRPQETFSGLRATYYPTLNLGVNATYLTANSGRELVAYGGQYNIGDMNLFTEYGTAGNGKGIIGEAKYSGRALQATATYRDIDANYDNPVDYISYAGKKGIYSTLNCYPINNMTLSGRLDSYIDNLATDPSSTNTDASADISYNLSPSTVLYLSNWKNDRKGYERGGLAEGNSLSLSQAFYFLANNTIYFKAQPSKFDSFSTSEESYTEEKNIIGLNISIMDLVSLNFESEQAKRELITTGLNLEPAAYELRLDLHESRLAFGPVYFSGSVDYRKSINGDTATDETTSIYSDVTLRYKPDRDLSFYVTGIMSDVQGPDVDRVTAVQNHIKFGLNYAFNSNIYLKASNDLVEGYVFADKNGNGAMELDEQGIAGVMVIAGSRVGISDSKGYYSIKGLKANIASVDFSSLPKGYICTTAGSRSIGSDNNKRIDFGLIKNNVAEQPKTGFKITSIK